ncbi:cathepsin K-like isoform X2 [Coffea eugenioides]|uniref:cathepsin K-like isoform X2 n=1 Tax=Coffea eugenioides TaxID=49369 RepID=UPI000F606D18|nr:cathepsin K-like isoform X2 [Coffea eugenioides]
MTKETFAEIALMAAKPIPSSSTRKRKRMLFDDPFFEDVKFTCYDDNPDAITAVGDQGQTSTCYAFQSAEVSSTTHCLNGKSWVPVPLSTQELIDNVHDQMHLERTYVDAFGCSPASLTATFEYMKQFGLYESKVYPYVGMRVANPVIPDEALKTGVYMGPTPYEALIFKEAEVENHCVLVVGFGWKGKNSFFVVKNSRGDDWGYKGYGLVDVHQFFRFIFPTDTVFDLKRRGGI